MNSLKFIGRDVHKKTITIAIAEEVKPRHKLDERGISYLVGAQLPVVFGNILRGGPGLNSILPSQADYFQAVKGAGQGIVGCSSWRRPACRRRRI